jgi:DNA mismatch repair protein MutS
MKTSCYRKQLPVGTLYANDVFDRETQQLIMITGPNMSGKSAILRQTALIVPVAQMGSFVPAESVEWELSIKYLREWSCDNISMGDLLYGRNERNSFDIE